MQSRALMTDAKLSEQERKNYQVSIEQIAGTLARSG